eukprot:10402964-Alexandrium_andersonii.AAC.1
MSASLVGSEMCIRDRANGAKVPTKRADTAMDTPQIAAFKVHWSEQPRTSCLLYTSDAADDM